jgi:lactate dehydrogenase-like 2-hydroxyacid dehydrogenase
MVFYNRTPKQLNAQQVELETVFQQDIIFITIANNPETRQLLSNIATLIQEKHYIVDVSAYDELYDKAAVVTLLNEGKMRGYAL